MDHKEIETKGRKKLENRSWMEETLALERLKDPYIHTYIKKENPSIWTLKWKENEKCSFKPAVMS